MGDQWGVSSDVGSGLVMRIMRRYRLAEREGKGGEVENLRAELLNDPHTLLLLPDIRMRLYQMSFTDRPRSGSALSDLDFHYVPMGNGWGISHIMNEFLTIAKSHSIATTEAFRRSVEDTTYFYLVGFDILVPEASANLTLFEDFTRLLSLSWGTGTSEALADFYLRQRFSRIFGRARDDEPEESASNAVVVAAVVVLLLYCVCQYLMLFVDRGRGSRSYSSGSLDFRDVYISIVLFHGAYVWIKFRQAATSGNSELKRKACEAQDYVRGVYCRAVKDKSGATTHYRYEPKFKPPREKLDSGTILQFNCLSLGQYDTPGEAKIVHQIAEFYYGKGEGEVALEDGSFFAIPAMDEREKRLTGMDKAKWVTEKARQVFRDLHPESAVKSRKQSRTSSAHSDPSRRSIAPFPASRTSVDVERSESPLAGLACVGAEQVADGGGPTDELIPAPECSGVQYNVSGMENDAPEADGGGNLAGHDQAATMSESDVRDMIAELFSGSANVSSQQSSLLGSKILGHPSPPQPDHDATQGFVGIPNLHLTRGCESFVCEAIEERDPQLVTRLMTLLKQYGLRNADLQNHLFEGEVKTSMLQRVNEQLRAAKSQEAAAAEDLRLRLLAAEEEKSMLRRENEQLRAANSQEAAAAEDLRLRLLAAEERNSMFRRENEQLRAANSQEAAAAKSQVGTWLADFVIDLPQEERRQFLGP